MLLDSGHGTLRKVRATDPERGENGQNKSAEPLTDKCGTILKSDSYTQKRRLTVASGQLIHIFIYQTVNPNCYSVPFNSFILE